MTSVISFLVLKIIEFIYFQKSLLEGSFSSHFLNQTPRSVAESDNRQMLSPGDPRLLLKLKSMSFNRKFLLASIVFIGLRIWNIIADVVFGFVRPNHHHHYEALVYLDVSYMHVCVCVCTRARIREHVGCICKRVYYSMLVMNNLNNLQH